MKVLITLICLFVILVRAEFSHSSSNSPPFRKIMTVYFENEDRDDVLKQPGFASFAAHGTLLHNFSAITHPSQPNYIASIAGSTMGVKGDGIANLDGTHIGDLLEARGKSWKVYVEGYPGNCDLSARIGPYVRKHVPFLSFKNISENRERCIAHVVPAGQLAIDIQNNNLPDYSLYIPDMNNDGHDTGIAYADRYFVKTFAPLMKDPRFTQDLLFVVTFDEGSWVGPNSIYAAMVGPNVKSGYVNLNPYNHYSLLRTVEDAFELGTLGRNDAKARPIQGIWKN